MKERIAYNEYAHFMHALSLVAELLVYAIAENGSKRVNDNAKHDVRSSCVIVMFSRTPDLRKIKIC